MAMGLSLLLKYQLRYKMNRLIAILYILTVSLVGMAQQTLPDSLYIALQQAGNVDSLKFKATRAIYTFYEETNRDSALHYARLRNTIAKKNNRNIEYAYTLGQMGYQLIYLGQFSDALKKLTEALHVAENTMEKETWELTTFTTVGENRKVALSMINHMYGHLKLQTGSHVESIPYFKEGRRIGIEIGNHFRVIVADMVLANVFSHLNSPDSALFYAIEGEQYGKEGNILKYLANIYYSTGDIYLQKGLDSLGLTYLNKSLLYAIPESNFSVVAIVYETFINYFYAKKNPDSMLYYAHKNLTVLHSMGAVTSFVAGDINEGTIYQQVANAYTLKNNKDSINKYLALALRVKDSLNSGKFKRMAAFQRVTLEEQVKIQNEEKIRVEKESQTRLYIFVAGLLLAFGIILMIYRNNRQKQKANLALKEQKEKVESTLHELKSTQAQLIQSEKMASLGELTAGIAHEIQNPLNFVNNFSEINNELIKEIKQELAMGNEQLAKGEVEKTIHNLKNALDISNDIESNSEKINQHGQRASSIVKGMLEHSRKSSGEKTPTDINALCDEYLRLSYHGLRAKDKNFNADYKIDLDPNMPKINVVSQDIARVLLNIMNNAFQACAEKSGSLKLESQEVYKPLVTVNSIYVASLPAGEAGLRRCELTITDNGPGIPDSIKDKIFQPFFTTKPTGQGTGLGLSLSYDIIKAHGGTITVNSKYGSPGAEIKVLSQHSESPVISTEFIIQIPIQ